MLPVTLTFEFVGKILKCNHSLQKKPTEQYFSVALFIVLHKVALTFESVDEILSVTTQVKATEQYFPVVLFVILYKVVLTFETVDKILKCDHSNESYCLFSA